MKITYLLLTLITIIFIQKNVHALETTNTYWESKFECPKINNPDPQQDTDAWLQVFGKKSQQVGAPMYGINIWQVDKINLLESIQNMLAQGQLAFTESIGNAHSIKVYKDDESDFFTVVFIYQWMSFGNGQAPIDVRDLTTRFLDIVEAYNWTAVKQLNPDLFSYSKMINRKFHRNICYYKNRRS
ncbi:hypothetical protein [Agarilytica rhodophyticola]|uniref:hypothetical protein n=1 Tax=Agarilytica rhodophyticola TaxID=1737490 RepID=UPI000B34325B|nr:hypothetical protein [Agarilytica rhodophyticola]